MKCGSYWKGKSVKLSTKEEYTPGQLTTIKDNFRAYDSTEEGIKGYFDFISTKRYANLKDATTPREYLEMIKKDGYATSSAYVSTCMSVVNRYDLERFDWVKLDNSNPYYCSGVTLRKNSKGDSVRWLQWELQHRGYDCGQIDGLFGEKTRTAVLIFQRDQGLVPDGIVGNKTYAAL